MITCIKKQQTTIATIRRQIIELLHLDEDKFHHTIYETGMLYLHAYFADEAVIDFVSRRKEFWNWWKNQWFIRDQVFVESLELSYVSLSYRHALYEALHNPQVLAAEIFPGRVVLGNDFTTTQMTMR